MVPKAGLVMLKAKQTLFFKNCRNTLVLFTSFISESYAVVILCKNNKEYSSGIVIFIYRISHCAGKGYDPKNF